MTNFRHPFVGKSYRPKIQVGRPKQLDMKKVTVTLRENQINRLDQLSKTIRDSGAIVDRSALIRSIIDALDEKQVQEMLRIISQKL